MAVELVLFGIVLGAAVLLYLVGLGFKMPHLMIFGCVFLLGSAALLWGSGGLITGHYYDVDGVLQPIVTLMSDTGLAMLSYALVGIGLVSLLGATFSGAGSKVRQVSPFHY